MASPIATQALLPTTISKGRIHYAPGIRAGNWVFATGQKATAAYGGGIAPEVTLPTLPHSGTTKYRREADRIFANLDNIMSAGGTSLTNIVRLDQNYTSGRAVEAYHDARRAILKDYIPPSTSTLVDGFLLRDQDIEVHAIAVVPGSDFRPSHIRPAEQKIHHTSAYSLALEVGDFVFVSGRMADSLTLGEGLAKEARMPEGHLWKGLPIKLQTEFIVQSKIEPALVAAGSSLDNIVKCQVYMRDPEDFGAFNEVWSQFFAGEKPATTLIPTATPGFFLSDARIEINTIALRDEGRTQKETFATDSAEGVPRLPHAVRAGDLLFLSGLLAIDHQGLVEEARIDPAQPYFGSSVAAQMRTMLSNATAICEAAGASLANVVRIQQYHTDLREFNAAYEVWNEYLPDAPLPLSAMKVPFLPVPDCTIQLDLWVYAPQHSLR